MISVLLGWFLIIVGALFILIGLVRAARETLSKVHAFAPGIKGVIVDVEKLLEALAKLPAWMLMVLVGLYLIYAGQQVLGGQLPWPL